jgi:diacylglycerol kinase family enzyme
MRIGLLNNLRAGRNQRRVERILAELGRAPDVIHFETTSAAAVPEALGELERADAELLIVNGGDGTIEHVLTEILGQPGRGWRPVIAPIRGGRTNMTAADLGARRNPVRGLTELLEAARAGRLAERIVERAVLRVDPGAGGTPRYGMFAGAGFLARAVTLTKRHLPKGRAQEGLGVAMVVSTLLTRLLAGVRGDLLAADKMQLALDGRQLPGEEYVIVLFTTLERLLFGMRPYWGAGPGSIRATIISGNAERLARAVPPILFGRPPAFATAEAGYTSENVASAALQLDTGVTVDGELFPIEPNRTYAIDAPERVRFARA